MRVMFLQCSAQRPSSNKHMQNLSDYYGSAHKLLFWPGLCYEAGDTEGTPTVTATVIRKLTEFPGLGAHNGIGGCPCLAVN